MLGLRSADSASCFYSGIPDTPGSSLWTSVVVNLASPALLGTWALTSNAEVGSTCDQMSWDGSGDSVGIVHVEARPEDVVPSSFHSDTLSAPAAKTLTWSDLLSDRAADLFRSALNSSGDSVEVSVSVGGGITLFGFLELGAEVTLNAGVTRNEDDHYEIGFDLGQTQTAGVGVGPSSSANIERGARGRFVVTVQSLEGIPAALEHMLVALLVEPHRHVINGAITAINESLATVERAIVELEFALNGLGEAFEVQAECIEDDWSLGFPWRVDDLFDCARSRLIRRLEPLLTRRDDLHRRLDTRSGAIDLLGSAQDFFKTDSSALVSVSLAIEFHAGASLEAQLSPFPGVTVEGLTAGVSLSGKVGGGARIVLDNSGRPERAVITVTSTVATAATVPGLEAGAEIGVEIETPFSFPGRSARPYAHLVSRHSRPSARTSDQRGLGPYCVALAGSSPARGSK